MTAKQFTITSAGGNAVWVGDGVKVVASSVRGRGDRIIATITVTSEDGKISKLLHRDADVRLASQLRRAKVMKDCAARSGVEVRPHVLLGIEQHLLKQQQAASEPVAETEYAATEHGLVWNKRTLDGLAAVSLCNFTARIIEDELRDDGAEHVRQFVIEAAIAGRRARQFTVPAARFAGMT